MMKNKSLKKILSIIGVVFLLCVSVASIVMFVFLWVKQKNDLMIVAATIFSSSLSSSLTILTLWEMMETNIRDKEYAEFSVDRIKNKLEESTSFRSMKLFKYLVEEKNIFIDNKKDVYYKNKIYNDEVNTDKKIKFSIKYLCDSVDAIDFCIVDNVQIGLLDRQGIIELINIEQNEPYEHRIVRYRNNRFELLFHTDIEQERLDRINEAIRIQKHVKLKIYIEMKLVLHLNNEKYKEIEIQNVYIINYVKRNELKNEHYFKRFNDNEAYLK